MVRKNPKRRSEGQGLCRPPRNSALDEEYALIRQVIEEYRLPAEAPRFPERPATATYRSTGYVDPILQDLVIPPCPYALSVQVPGPLLLPEEGDIFALTHTALISTYKRVHPDVRSSPILRVASIADHATRLRNLSCWLRDSKIEPHRWFYFLLDLWFVNHPLSAHAPHALLAIPDEDQEAGKKKLNRFRHYDSEVQSGVYYPPEAVHQNVLSRWTRCVMLSLGLNQARPFTLPNCAIAREQFQRHFPEGFSVAYAAYEARVQQQQRLVLRDHQNWLYVWGRYVF